MDVYSTIMKRKGCISQLVRLEKEKDGKTV